jgi:hypothetical protein
MAPEDVNTPRRLLSRFAPVTALAVASLFLVQCERKPEPAPQPAPPAAEPAPPPKPIVVAPPPPLSRADILAALAGSAAAYAAGEAPSADPLAGRAFAIRLPFGCGGPASDAAPEGLAQWAWGQKQETIKLSLTPADWSKSPLIAAAEGETPWETAEGFWIARPWMTAETCPAAFGSAAPDGAAPASPQTAGLVAVFDAKDSRFGRRNGRAYSFTVRPSGETPLTLPDRGYRVVLEGRLGAFPDGRAIRCRADGPDQRPVCVAAVQLDRVAFEDGASGVVLSEWRKG